MSYEEDFLAKIKFKLEKYADRLDISVFELIDKYIRMELYMDEYYDNHPSEVLENWRRAELEKMKRKAMNKNLKKDETHKKSVKQTNDENERTSIDFDKEVRLFSMYFNYKIKDPKLRKMVERKTRKLNISVEDLIWRYVNRGLMNDTIRKDELEYHHSNGFLEEINGIMGLEDYKK